MCNQEEENIETVKKILEAGFQNLLVFLVILAVIDSYCHHCLPDSVKSSLSCISKDHRSIQLLQVVVRVAGVGQARKRRLTKSLDSDENFKPYLVKTR